MADIHQSYQEIIKELTRLQNPVELAKDKPFFPGLIAVGPEGSILVNEKIDADIQKVADWIRQQRSIAKSQYSLKEWRTEVRKAFGPALVQIDLDDPISDNGRKLKKLVEQTLSRAQIVVPSRFMTIGCTLLDNPLTAPLVIGPVQFAPKEDWLARAVKTGQIDKVSQVRLARAFSGKTLRARKDMRLDLYEKSILEVLRDAQLACTVETNDLAPEMAQDRAIIGARLAQTALALLWRKPSRALEGFHLSVDHGYRRIRTIPFIPPDNRMIGAWRPKGSPRGPHIEPADWTKLVSKARGFLDLAGQMIFCWTSASAYNHASPLLRKLAQSIFFFWEGCRDENDLMAIVKFTASLEALSKPHSSGITQLITARLGKKSDEKFVGDRTVKEVVELVYSSGRSRTLHGTNPDILHDWSEARAIAEGLARYCLVKCMDWAKANPSATSANAFLT